MPRCIIKLAENEYVEWSTIVDAPVSYIVDRAQAVDQFGRDRIERADQHGTSMIPWRSFTRESFLEFNRAGENEERLSVDEIRKQFAAPLSGGDGS